MAKLESIVLILSLLWTSNVAYRGDIEQQFSENYCASFDTCSDCLKAPKCAWCSEPEFELKMRSDGVPFGRCNLRKMFNSIETELDCSPDFLIDVRTRVDSLMNQSLSGKNIVDGEPVVQMQPQKLLIQTRLHTPVNFEIKFSPVQNHPLDLYFIMDGSQSMENDRKTLAESVKTLVATLKTLTSSLQIGFGSFVDKSQAPFSSETSESKGGYLFKHQSKLSPETAEFTTKLESMTSLKTLDGSHGGLEALLQVAVCEDALGWRHNSRRLVVFISDSTYHIAGDGKLAGIVRPNDERCHLDQNGVYVSDRGQDFPSVAQVGRNVANQSINVLFAVPASVTPSYQLLTKRLQGAAVIVTNQHLSNIVQLIKDHYQKLWSSVELRHKSSASVELKYFSSCLTGDDPIETQRCDGLVPGSIVEFTVQVQVANCPNDENFSESIYIYPIGIRERLKIELDVQCRCQCDNHMSNLGSDPQCSGLGQYNCGTCRCNPGYTGLKCNCGPQNATRSTVDSCKSPSNPSLDCSGRGICQCDVCHCMKPANHENRIWGQFCECDNFKCLRGRNNLICSGHGACRCSGFCECLPGWTGESCDCSSDESACWPGNGLPKCSGNGHCECGKCVCNEVQEGFFKGKYCQDCPNCLCSEYADCVKLVAFNVGPANLEDCEKFDIHLVDDVQVSEEEKFCQSDDGDTPCRLIFAYNPIRPREIRVRKCPASATAIAGGMTGSILAIGLLLLTIWKVTTVVHDRMEYIRFQKERAMAKWQTDANPMYRRPTTIYQNPTYTAE